MSNARKDASDPGARREQHSYPFKKGEELILTPDRAAFNGSCVARVDGMAVFVTGCVPGDTVRARVIKRRKSHGEARTLEVLEGGADRVDPTCDYFEDCGGCKWQNLAYESQIAWKQQHVFDAFQRIGKLNDVEVRPTLPADDQLWYRNKMEFSFGTERWLTAAEIDSSEDIERSFALGLHAPGRYNRVLDISKCWLQSEVSNRLVNLTREFALSHSIPAYTTDGHTGILRNLVVRNSVATGEVMGMLITAGLEDELIRGWSNRVSKEIPEVTTLLHGLHTGKAGIATAEKITLLYGPGTITESIAGHRFTISPFSFFQTNPVQGERLYGEAMLAGDIKKDDLVWDLYCGAGTITLAAARRAEHVIGAEINEGSVLDARTAASTNGLENVEFYSGDLKDLIGSLGRGLGREGEPDLVITDPPRAGMHQDVVDALLERRPRAIVYISCNPTTQARDCELLSVAYDVEYVQPVDMFPQTYHIETVARLTLRQESEFGASMSL